MSNLYFEKNKQYSKEDVIDFFSGYDDIEKKLVNCSIFFFVFLFFLGWIFVDFLSFNFTSVFMAFLFLSFGYVFQITKLIENFSDNEKNLIPILSAEQIINVVESDSISIKTKKMVLSLSTKRKLEYSMSICESNDTKSKIKNIYNKL